MEALPRSDKADLVAVPQHRAQRELVVSSLAQGSINGPQDRRRPGHRLRLRSALCKAE